MIDERRNAENPPPAPGSKPRWRIFLPYVVLAVVLAAAFVWIYFLGPQGANREPMQQETSMQFEQPPAEVAA